MVDQFNLFSKYPTLCCGVLDVISDPYSRRFSVIWGNYMSLKKGVSVNLDFIESDEDAIVGLDDVGLQISEK